MLKTFKDYKRRSVQTLLQTAGKADSTEDKDYDAHVKQFHEMLKGMNSCSSAQHAYLSKQKEVFVSGEQLVSIIHGIYQHNNEATAEWPDVVNNLEYMSQAEAFKEMWHMINGIIRSSATAVCSTSCIDALKTSAGRLGPDIDGSCKTRNAHLVDYDSYRRRVETLQEKLESMKADESKEKQRSTIEQDLEKTSHKLEASKINYEHNNEKCKEDIIAAKLSHDEMIDEMLLTTVVAQAELFSKAAYHLEEIAKSFPADKVAFIREKVTSNIQNGGVHKEEKKKSIFKMFGATDKKDEGSKSNVPFSEGDANPFESGDKVTKVEALFDHEADEEDELSFKVGQIILVTEQTDQGWWKGSYDGKSGLFPTNYVKVL